MQLKLISGTWAKHRFAFGGTLLKGSHPKTKRLFRPKLPLHVVMRSSKACGPKSFFSFNQKIGKILSAQAERHHVKIFAAANAGNHVHLLTLAPSQSHLSNFLRAIAGRVAQLATDSIQPMATPANNSCERERFWDARPFSRIVSWGRDFKSVLRYLGLNVAGALGFSRDEARQMHERIQQALKNGQLAKASSLIAAGFV